MTMRLFTTFAVFAAIGVSAFAAPPVVPRPAKELEIIEPGAKSGPAERHDLLTSYRGKVVVVQFLYTTCPHCQAYSQVLTKLQHEYGPKGFQCLGAAFNEADSSMVANYIAQYKVGFPVGPMGRDTVLSFLGLSVLERFVVPQVVLIDRKGQIREQTEANPTTLAPLQNEAHLRASIEKLLSEGAVSTGKSAPATGSSSTKTAPKKPLS
jgi:thiol-disulfide isomerase/thioredoxin